MNRVATYLATALVTLAMPLTGCETSGSTDAGTDAQPPAAARSAAPRPEHPSGSTRARRPRVSQPRSRAATRRRRIGTAAFMLARIPTRPQRSVAPYERNYFGDGWTSRAGCTTRQRVLIDEARSGRDVGCSVQHGRWTSAYDGERFTNPSKLDIDHLVPLGEAWRSGASRWTAGTRIRYANDMGYRGSLRAVSAGSNRSKGDDDPSLWLPPRRIHRCKYIGTWIAVKYRWHLSMNGTERGVLRRFVRDCGRKADVPIPRRARVRIARHPVAAPRAERGHRSGRSHAGSRGDPRFATCKQAIAHGYGPYRRGVDREYPWYTDRDRDGLVCER